MKLQSLSKQNRVVTFSESPTSHENSQKRIFQTLLRYTFRSFEIRTFFKLWRNQVHFRSILAHLNSLFGQFWTNFKLLGHFTSISPSLFLLDLYSITEALRSFLVHFEYIFDHFSSKKVLFALFYEHFYWLPFFFNFQWRFTKHCNSFVLQNFGDFGPGFSHGWSHQWKCAQRILPTFLRLFVPIQPVFLIGHLHRLMENKSKFFIFETEKKWE